VVVPKETRAASSWYDSAWQYRKKITISSAGVSANLNNFPVLVSLASDADLSADAQNDGDDILFTADDEVTKLSHEIESFDGASGKLVAWVRIPSLSSSVDTVIYIYYGNTLASNQQDAANVWDTSFKMVQHLQESAGGAGAIKDSTSNINHGTDNNTPTFGASGQINGAIGFDGTGDSIDFGSNNSLKMTDALTIGLWVNRPDNATFERFLSHSIDTSNYAYELGVDVTDKDNWRFRLNNDAVTLKTLMVGSPGQWLYLVVTYDKDAGGTDEIKMYENGSLIGTQDYSIAMANHGILSTNRQGKFDGWVKSTIDEVRISDTARSSDWILTSYNNQSSPASFYTIGSEEVSVPMVTVGGKVFPISKTAVLAPWLVLISFLMVTIWQLNKHL
jgi:MSHA biogenesis protein MshQ